MPSHDYAFDCPLPNGLHARPASRLAEVAARFSAEITLLHERTGSSANAKSALALIALDVRPGDGCRLRATGGDAGAAHAALREFITAVLPGCDEPLPAGRSGGGAALPRSLRGPGIRGLAGTAASPGIGQGVVVMAGGRVLPGALAQERTGSIGEEQEKVRRAIAAVRAALEARLAARPAAAEAGILGAHLSMAGDVALAGRILESVSAGRPAGQAIVEAAAFFTAPLKAAESPYVRERALDVEDVCLQLLERIEGACRAAVDLELRGPSVVVAETLTPRQFLALDRRHLQALVLERGGTTSHAVILARSFGVPTLTGVTEARSVLRAGQEVVVDADTGILIPEVTVPVQRYYERRSRALQRRQERLAAHALEAAMTRDGRRLEVAANVASAGEVGPACAQGADGVGLFRTEVLFMDRETPPSEEEQAAVYAEAARAASGRPVIIRTLDIGGDKPVPYLRLPQEANPFLGYRGVRIYPGHRDLFMAQLRAILRASAAGRVWAMVPMVCTLEEVRWVKERLAEARADLQAGGVAFDPDLPLGVMIEVPSAALIVDQLAEEVAFFSIGTNDLAQYFLAVDRGSEQVAGLYDARHPAFLRLLARIVAEARAHGRWVGLCGEMARNVRDLPLLIGLGLDEISAAASEIPALKAAVRRASAAECRAALQNAMACRSIAEVEGVLAAFGTRGAAPGLLEPDLIAMDSDSASKEEAIAEVVNAFFAAGRTEDPQALEEAVWAREAVYSTGLGHGFAIPHCRSDAVTADSVGVLRLRQPIEWDSVDGEPVRCVILLATRESDPDDTHMRVFAKLARRLVHEEFRARLLAVEDADAVLDCLTEELGLPAQPTS